MLGEVISLQEPTIQIMSNSKVKMVRFLVGVSSAIELIVLAVWDFIMLTGPDSWGIGRAVAIGVTVPTLLLIAPAAILVILNRWIPLALILCMMAVPLAIFIWQIA